MYPLRFEPIYRSLVWGGDRIAKKFNRCISIDPCAESWEISDREEGQSIVANGAWQGTSLQNLLEKRGEHILGQGRLQYQFPLILKIIDAKERLSLQVHPDEIAAKHLQGEPKTEAWIVLQKGDVFVGLKPGVTQKELVDAIHQRNVEALLQKFSLQAGDVFYIPAGQVHAIDSGCMLLEVQQNSNTTYRLYDWHRTGRALHLDQALQSIHWEKEFTHSNRLLRIETDGHHRLEAIIQSPYFLIDRIEVIDQWNVFPDPTTCQILFFLEGSGEIEVDRATEPFSSGSTYLIPASSRLIEIRGESLMIRIRLPEESFKG